MGLKKHDWLDYNPMYISLGETEAERQNEFRRWFFENFSPAEWKYIRVAVQKNWAYGGNDFKEKMENLLGRKFEIKKAGRRPKI